MPQPVQRVDGLPRLGAHLVGERQRADHRAVDERRAARSRPRRARPRSAASSVSPGSREQPRPAHPNGPPVDRRGHTDAPATTRSPSRRGTDEPPPPRPRDDRPGQRVLAVGLGGGRQRQHLVVVRAAARPRPRSRPARPWSACRSCRTAPRRRSACSPAPAGPSPARRRAPRVRWRSTPPAGSPGPARAGRR